MSQNSQPLIPPGRVDELAKHLFGRLVKKYGNPELKFTCAMLQDEIEECFRENLGPGTKAHEIGRRVMRAIEGGRG